MATNNQSNGGASAPSTTGFTVSPAMQALMDAHAAAQAEEERVADLPYAANEGIIAAATVASKAAFVALFQYEPVTFCEGMVKANCLHGDDWGEEYDLLDRIVADFAILSARAVRP